MSETTTKSRVLDMTVYSGDIEPSARGFRATITDE